MTPSDFEVFVRKHAVTVGLTVISVTTKEHDLGNGFAVTDIIVENGPKGASNGVYRRMGRMNVLMNKELGSEVRLDYYDADIGYDVPKGQAMIQADLHVLEFKDKLVRAFSAAGPCLTLGKLAGETPKFWTYHPWISGRRYEITTRKVAKRTDARYSAAHVDPCPSCTDHPKTQYPNGHMD